MYATENETFNNANSKYDCIFIREEPCILLGLKSEEEMHRGSTDYNNKRHSQVDPMWSEKKWRSQFIDSDNDKTSLTSIYVTWYVVVIVRNVYLSFVYVYIIYFISFIM
jgi:hypothetical protein